MEIKKTTEYVKEKIGTEKMKQNRKKNVYNKEMKMNYKKN